MCEAYFETCPPSREYLPIRASFAKAGPELPLAEEGVVRKSSYQGYVETCNDAHAENVLERLGLGGQEAPPSFLRLKEWLEPGPFDPTVSVTSYQGCREFCAGMPTTVKRDSRTLTRESRFPPLGDQESLNSSLFILFNIGENALRFMVKAFYVPQLQDRIKER